MAYLLECIYERYFNTMMEDGLEFWSIDSQFGLRIEHSQIKRLIDFCKKSRGKETGGILIGYYSTGLNCAVITTISGPPSDSKANRNWFYRGIRGLQRWLNLLWKKERHYYLGEWHFHPDNEPSASPDDIQQMMKIAYIPECHCPEPVLLIVGFDPSILIPSECFKVYTFKKGQYFQLHCRTPNCGLISGKKNG